MLCWYSGKDTGLPPRRPQIESHSQQAFLQKALTQKKFKNLAKIDLKLIWITLEKPYWQSLLWIQDSSTSISIVVKFE